MRFSLTTYGEGKGSMTGLHLAYDSLAEAYLCVEGGMETQVDDVAGDRYCFRLEEGVEHSLHVHRFD